MVDVNGSTDTDRRLKVSYQNYYNTEYLIE